MFILVSSSPPPLPDMFSSLSTMFPLPSNMFTSLLSMFIFFSPRHVYQFIHHVCSCLFLPPPSPTCLPVYLPCFLFPLTCLPVYSPCLLFLSLPRHVYQFIHHVYSFVSLPQLVYQFIHHVYSCLFPPPSPTCLLVYSPYLLCLSPPRHVYQFIHHVYSFVSLPHLFTSLSTMFILVSSPPPLPRHVYQFIHHVYSFVSLP